jgi:GNAT superfamily N-acetyltransferase
VSERALTLTNDEAREISARLFAFNDTQVAYTQAPPIVHLNYGIKNAAGELIAGILAVLYCWKILSIEVLWTDQKARCGGFGSVLLEKTEGEARRNGAVLAHLDTFDFQARSFYEKRGYDVFGALEGCPSGHTRFYMKKVL